MTGSFARVANTARRLSQQMSMSDEMLHHVLTHVQATVGLYGSGIGRRL